MLLAEVFSRVFDQPAETFTDESSQETVMGWTSLEHVALLVQVERAYGVKFSNPELAALRSMGDVRAALHRKGVQVS